MVEENKFTEWTKKITKRLSTLQIGLLVVILAYLGWFVIITNPVPNFDNSTQTVIYTPTSDVVKEPITVPHIIGLGTIIFFLVMSFVKEEFGGEISAKEAYKILKEQLDYEKNVLRIPDLQGELFIGPGKKMKRQSVVMKDEQNVQGSFYSKSWYFNVRVRPSDKPEKFYLGEVNARSGAPYDLLELEKPFDFRETCPRCGSIYDTRVVITSDVKYYRDLQQAGLAE